MFNLSGLNPKERFNIQISNFLIEAMNSSSKYASQAIDIFISPVTSLSAIEKQSRVESIKKMDAEYAVLKANEKKIKAVLVEEPVTEPIEPPDERRPEFWDSKVRELTLQYNKDVTPKRSWTVKVTEPKRPETPGKPGWFSVLGRGGTRKRKRVKRTRKT